MDLSMDEIGVKVLGTAKATIRCGLCRETIELETNFRPTPAVCPHCGLKFTFDPQKQPLPVRGMRLNWSEVDSAQGPRGSGRHRVHEAHVSSQLAARPLSAPPARTNFLAWAGSIALAIAALLTLLSWFRR